MGRFAKRRKEGRVAARCIGWERKKNRETGETLGLEVRWALGRFGLLSRALERLFFFLQISFAKNLNYGDERLGKTFFVNSRKNKIGFNKNNFC